eukprot:81043-Amphidinium_carterae.1
MFIYSGWGVVGREHPKRAWALHLRTHEPRYIYWPRVEPRYIHFNCCQYSSKRFVELLRSTRILTHDLAFGPTKYMGVIRVHDLHRRLDPCRIQSESTTWGDKIPSVPTIIKHNHHTRH